MRWIFAVVFGLHGIAHLVGFAVTWRVLRSPEVPYKTTVLGGTVDLGDIGARVLGLLWLALAIASLVLCAISLPEARIGLAINVLLIAVLVVGPRAGFDVYRNSPASASHEGAR